MPNFANKMEESYMIEVTRFNNSTFLVNADLIETVEETPDTVITLANGRKYIVKESAESIKSRIIEYKNNIFRGVFFK